MERKSRQGMDLTGGNSDSSFWQSGSEDSKPIIWSFEAIKAENSGVSKVLNKVEAKSGVSW